MSPQLPTYELHPEFGYLCASHQLRQNVRVGLTAAAFGLITGVGGALALLPWHSDHVAWTEPALAAAADSTGQPTPLTGSGLSSLPKTPDTAKRVSADGVVKHASQGATTSPGVGATSEAPVPVEIPARAVLSVTSDRTVAIREAEQGRGASSKRVKTARSSLHRRAREPARPDTFVTRPLGFQLSPFAYDTRSGRRRDGGDGWSW
jgi:hypothetical protein